MCLSFPTEKKSWRSPLIDRSLIRRAPVWIGPWELCPIGTDGASEAGTFEQWLQPSPLRGNELKNRWQFQGTDSEWFNASMSTLSSGTFVVTYLKHTVAVTGEDGPIDLIPSQSAHRAPCNPKWFMSHRCGFHCSMKNLVKSEHRSGRNASSDDVFSKFYSGKAHCSSPGTAHCGSPGGANCGSGGANCGSPGGANCGSPCRANCGSLGRANCGSPRPAHCSPRSRGSHRDWGSPGGRGGWTVALSGWGGGAKSWLGRSSMWVFDGGNKTRALKFLDVCSKELVLFPERCAVMRNAGTLVRICLSDSKWLNWSGCFPCWIVKGSFLAFGSKFPDFVPIGFKLILGITFDSQHWWNWVCAYFEIASPVPLLTSWEEKTLQGEPPILGYLWV